METYGTPNTPTEVSTSATTPDGARCAVADRLGPSIINAIKSMKRNGEIHTTDWKLWMCDQANGRDFLHSWGPEAEARSEMRRMASHDRDVWLIAPDGTKHLPA